MSTGGLLALLAVLTPAVVTGCGPVAAQRRDAPVRQVSAGQFHTCEIRGTATYCWGWGYRGQLGDGGAAIRATPVRVRAPRGVVFTQLAAGSGHTCGLSGSTTYCWGMNLHGALGDGSTTDRATPVRVRTPRGVVFTQLAAGSDHTCGLSGTKIYCWGWGDWGQLGNGSTADRTTPVPVRAPRGAAFTGISAGGATTCGTTAGTTYCWGSGGLGELGDGGSANRSTPVPVRVPRGVVFTRITTGGGGHSCGISGTGTYCWGGGTTGELGDGTTAIRRTPVLVRAPRGVIFTQITAGGLHTCGIAGSRAYCWGRGENGQLGDGGTEDRTTPVPVRVPRGVVLTQLSAGGSHTCGIAGARTYCWGLRNDEPFHDEIVPDGQPTPKEIPFPEGFPGPGAGIPPMDSGSRPFHAAGPG